MRAHLIAAQNLLCDLRDAGISVAPAGDRLAISSRGSIPEEVREWLRAEKAPLLRLLTEAAKIAEAQAPEVTARRVEAGMELLWEMELAGRSEEAEYTRHLAMFLVVLCALEIAGL